MRKIDITGQKFGRLTVLKHTHSNSDKKCCWDCVCECGNMTNVSGKSLRNGNTKSCGCLGREIRIKSNTTHGYCTGGKTSEYQIWRSIKERCLNSKNKKYSDYGGRGIIICDRWKDSFQNFIDDMGVRHNKNLSIDRINNNGNYDPTNCKWATWIEQQNNKNNNRILEFNGKSQTVAQWSRELGVPHQRINQRLFRNWSIERTLTQNLK